MSGQLFRKSSIERISSPEQLNDYVHVSSPGVWTVLSCIAVLLIGICAWGIFGRLETKLAVAGVCGEGVFTCYVREKDIGDVQAGMEIEVSGKKYAVSDISEVPLEISGEMDSYLLHVGDFRPGEWVYEVRADAVRRVAEGADDVRAAAMWPDDARVDAVRPEEEAAVEDGIYEASIVTERVSPMLFIWN